ncbi:MAG TPA: MoaD/ThiS family protein [Kiloniellales bacterium]|nr:MoaD/ThiS family protein [Kiloniellales bacterium]
MPSVHFTGNLQRYLPAPSVEVSGGTVRAALDSVFADNPALRSYLLDDQGRLRRHVNVFVNGQQVRDRNGLSDPIGDGDEVYVIQALSGG